MKKTIWSILALVLTLASSGKPGTKPQASNPIEVQTSDERAPAGAVVQAKFQFAKPHALTSGSALISMDSSFKLEGVAVNSPAGETYGVAVTQPKGGVLVSLVSPNGDLGTNTDAPFLSLNMRIPADAQANATFPIAIADSDFQTPTDVVTLSTLKPGTLTVGGSLSISGIYPGGGTWPAGTVASIRGTGFQKLTNINTRLKITGETFVSSEEMQFTLKNATTLDGTQFILRNPQGEAVSYFSYLNPYRLSGSAAPLLQRTEPIFQGKMLGNVFVQAVPITGATTALAIQNPNPGPVSVFVFQAGGIQVAYVLPPGGRVMDTLAGLVNAPGTVQGIYVQTTSHVQMLGLTLNEGAGTVTPFLVSELVF